jgi:uncharacterized linocin/CFP29 family protein
MSFTDARLDLHSGFAPRGNSGAWAGAQFIAAMNNGQNISPAILRANGVLRKDEWVYFDNELLEGAVPELRAVADLINAGLTKPLPNAMGKTVIEYDRYGDLADATVSMDGLARTDNDRPTWSRGRLPVPITHKDWNIPLRSLAASRNGQEPLDTTMTRLAGRKVAQMQERMLINGSKSFGDDLHIYGYTTHPLRQTASFSGGLNWEDPTKTGDGYLTDVQTALGQMTGQSQNGPYVVYISRGAGILLDRDFKANGSDTIRQRLLRINGISAITELDFLAEGNVLFVQMRRETVVLIQGEPLQTIQWDIDGGMGVEFKAFQIQVPLVRALDGESGIVHMS